jgi:ferredoxin-type protein NapH
MSYSSESLRVLFGGAPKRAVAEEITSEAKEIHIYKKLKPFNKAEFEKIRQQEAISTPPHKWRNRRWITLIVVNFLFLVSFYFDVQLLEGTLSASRFIGFHMADLNSALQVMLAYKLVVLNLIIGTVTIFVLWLLLGGRTFCSWVCPYHLVAEWAEALHLWLAKKKIVQDRSFNRKVRTVLYVIFALLAFVTGYTVFETISPTGILSRAIIYGPGLALILVGILLLLEVFYSRRVWCRYICPIGITYGLVGSISPLRVKYNIKDCHHEGDCIKVCLVPHVLSMTVKGRAADVDQHVGADCTRCGLCVDICPTDSLKFDIKGLSKHL